MNKKTNRNIAITTMTMLSVIMLGGCDFENKTNPQVPTVKQEQENRGAEAYKAVKFSGNAEIDNIQKRLELTSKPGALGYIILFNQSGQPIIYEGVVGKITSGRKRLSAPDKVEPHDIHGTNGGVTYVVRQSGSDEGTFGSSDNYIYYWNTDGAYRQWFGSYLYSDQPMRLTVQPLVVTIKTDEKK